MEQNFYRGRLINKHGLNVLIPNEADRALVHRVIYDELVMGKIKSISKAKYLKVIDGLVKEGAEGIILGCTEIGLLIEQQDAGVPVFDTAEIHARMAVEYALDTSPGN
jgi:aspartate racemase